MPDHEPQVPLVGVPSLPWTWTGGYPQRITGPDATLIAEVFENPDVPAVMIAPLICKAVNAHFGIDGSRNCPTPEFHKTHRYCPSCPWTEPQETQVEVVGELPPRLDGTVRYWLEANQREAVDVKHGVFPLGMVQRWVERAEAAEAEIERLRGLRDEAAQMPWSFNKGSLRERLEWCRVQHQIAAENPPLYPPTREQKADFDRACVGWYDEMVAQCDELLLRAGEPTS